MFLSFLKSKIHGATVTAVNLDYEGSIAIDATILEMAGIFEHEEVHVWNRTNGNRFITYAIKALPNSGTIMINGAAGHLAKKDDKVIIASFCYLNSEEMKKHHPMVLMMNEKNQGKLKP